MYFSGGGSWCGVVIYCCYYRHNTWCKSSPPYWQLTVIDWVTACPRDTMASSRPKLRFLGRPHGKAIHVVDDRPVETGRGSLRDTKQKHRWKTSQAHALPAFQFISIGTVQIGEVTNKPSVVHAFVFRVERIGVVVAGIDGFVPAWIPIVR